MSKDPSNFLVFLDVLFDIVPFQDNHESNLQASFLAAFFTGLCSPGTKEVVASECLKTNTNDK